MCGVISPSFNQQHRGVEDEEQRKRKKMEEEERRKQEKEERREKRRQARKAEQEERRRKAQSMWSPVQQLLYDLTCEGLERAVAAQQLPEEYLQWKNRKGEEEAALRFFEVTLNPKKLRAKRGDYSCNAAVKLAGLSKKGTKMKIEGQPSPSKKEKGVKTEGPESEIARILVAQILLVLQEPRQLVEHENSGNINLYHNLKAAASGPFIAFSFEGGIPEHPKGEEKKELSVKNGDTTQEKTPHALEVTSSPFRKK